MGIPKHLAVLGDEPLLVRACRQFRERLGVHPVVAAHDPRIVEVMGEHCFTEHSRGIVSAGALSTKPYWKDETWLLFGDLYWDCAAMDQVTSAKGLKAFWWGTTFLGFHWDNDQDRQRVEAALRTTVLASKTSEAPPLGSSRKMGYLLYAFHALQGLPLVENPETLNGMKHRKDSPLVEEIRGQARDFDYPDEYEQFKLYHTVDDLLD